MALVVAEFLFEPVIAIGVSAVLILVLTGLTEAVGGVQRNSRSLSPRVAPAGRDTEPRPAAG